MQSTLESYAEWNRGVVVTEDLQILAKTHDFDKSELQWFVKMFDDYDTTMSRGVSVEGHLFEVHRIYDDLIFGRRGAPEGEGFCLTRCKRHGKQAFSFITYGFPTLSAKAVPELQYFSKSQVEKL